MNKKFILILTIVFTILSIIFIMFDWDRTIKLYFNSYDNLINDYKLKPKAPKRVVAVLELQEGESPSPQTIKSLLDQNLRVHDIAIQSKNLSDLSKDHTFQKIATFHKPHTEWLRETENDTVVIHLQNGKEYSYGFIDDRLQNN